MDWVLRARDLAARPGLEFADLDLVPGTVLGLVGPSGAGKTRLARTLAGLDPVTGGSLERRGTVQYLHQAAGEALDPLWTGRALLDEARRFGRGRDVEGVAAGLQLEDETLELPARALSGGQRQRLAWARLRLLRPDAVLLDEPFTGQDPRLAGRLEAEITRWAEEGAALLLISHDLARLRRCVASAVVMARGRTVDRTDLVTARHPWTRRWLDAAQAWEAP